MRHPALEFPFDFVAFAMVGLVSWMFLDSDALKGMFGGGLVLLRQSRDNSLPAAVNMPIKARRRERKSTAHGRLMTLNDDPISSCAAVG